MSDDKGSVSEAQMSDRGPFARLGAGIDNLLRSMIPSGEACAHFSNARVELLRGMRAIIDARIDRLSSEGKKGVAIKIE
jgi:hypothetical protein